MPPNTPAIEKDVPGNKKTIKVNVSEDEILIDDKVYKVKELADTHPGGSLFVNAFAGRDATEAFLSYHRRSFPHQSQESSLIRTVQSDKKSGLDEDYLELCQLVEKVIPRNKSFATFGYWMKMVALLFFTVYLEVYIHITGRYEWYLTGFVGLCYALIGLNVQHDANHGALSRNPRVNRIMGLTQNYIGGSSLDWIHQHVVQHHITTNDVHDDPDIKGSDILRLNPLKPLLKHHAFQYLYVFVLLALFGFSVTLSSLMNIIQGKNHTKMSSKVNSYRLNFFLLLLLNSC